MINKSMVNDILYRVLKEDFVNRLWWDLRLPAFGGQSANEVWETDPARVLEYVQSYLDPSFT